MNITNVAITKGAPDSIKTQLPQFCGLNAYFLSERIP